MQHIITTRRVLKFVTLIRNMSAHMGTNRVAVCQMTSTSNKEKNMEIVSDLVHKAIKEHAKMIFFPEACDYLCENRKETIVNSEFLTDGATIKSYQKLARDNKVWLSMGGLHETSELNRSKVFNTHVIINDKGDIVQTYRKLHLFDVEIPEKKVRLKESDMAEAGSHIVTPVSTPVGELGLSICYDLRFPELSLQLAMMGAEILTYPSAFTHETGEAHWAVLLRTRAIENQCFVIAAAQVGQHNPKRRSYGRAMVVDPWGKVLADCGTSESPYYKVVDLDLNKLKDVRRNMPVFQHRRKDVYSLYALSLRNALLPPPPPNDTSGNQTQDSSVPYHGPTMVFGHIKVPDSCVFYKSEFTYALVNLRCVVPGHVLVAPIRLVERNRDLTDSESNDFYRTVRLVQELMEVVHKTDSCTVTIQDGPNAGQTVKHLHCHIMPRKKGDFIDNDLIYLELAKHDHIKFGQPSKPGRSLQEMEKEAKQLREALNKMNNKNTDR